MVLHQFGALDAGARTNSDGAKPLSGLAQGWDGSFYGATEVGGANGNGTIFKISPAGAFTLLHTFTAFTSGTNGDGAYPEGTLRPGPDGGLYGTTSGGGQFGNYGTVFKLTTNGVLLTLHTFNYSDGENPAAPLVLAHDGNFYGAAVLGGANANGTLFEISPAGDFQTLYDFSFAASDASNVYTNADGSRPYGITQGRDGNFYGTTAFGGTNGNGTVFQFTTNGVFNLLHTFSAQAGNGSNNDGAAPQAPLTQGPDGAFYGTAPYGGTNAQGTVFRITTGGVFSTLRSLDYFNDGGVSYAPLMLNNGQFYGTAAVSGTGGGTIFLITTNGALSALYSFSQPDGNSQNSDGAYPDSGLTLGRDGSLYGVTSSGGTNGTGTIFQLSFPALTMVRTGTQTILSWPTNQTGFSLQSATNLANPAWTAVLPAPGVVGSQFVVTNAAPGLKTFYRLVK